MYIYSLFYFCCIILTEHASIFCNTYAGLCWGCVEVTKIGLGTLFFWIVDDGMKCMEGEREQKVSIM